MGEANRRGSREGRVKSAIQAAKEAAYEKLGLKDPAAPENIALRTVHDAFIRHIGHDKWIARRAAIISRVNATAQVQERDLSKTKAIRDREDEIGWYLLLTELALNDPFCLENNQAARALPFLVGIGARWEFSNLISRLDEKVMEVVTDLKKDPDGGLFELLVALSYAEMGWDVEFIKTRAPDKSPDLLIKKGKREYFVECKKQSRRPEYALKEHNAFLNLWHALSSSLPEIGQALWFDIVFHTEVHLLPKNRLKELVFAKLPLAQTEVILIDNQEITIRAKKIDIARVQRRIQDSPVKHLSPLLRSLLAGDWAPRNSNGPMLVYGQFSSFQGCELSTSNWLNDIGWATGCTWYCDAEIAIQKKARDVNKLLSDAVDQLPHDGNSIIHIGIETLEGRQVDRLRAEKINRKITDFTSRKPIDALFVHSIQCNEVIDKLFEVDETVDKYFGVNGPVPDMPNFVLVRNGTEEKMGAHWNIYD